MEDREAPPPTTSANSAAVRARVEESVERPVAAVEPGAPPSRWRRWLAGGSAREVLARIVHGDPLHVREHVAQCLRRGAWLLDADRVQLRSLALIARHAGQYRGRPDLEPWLRGRIVDAIESLLREDAEVDAPADASRADGSEPNGAPLEAPNPASAFQALAKPLGLEPRAMGHACRTFNRLPFPERRSFCALVIHGQTLDDLSRESGESATDVARQARRALDAILNAHAALDGASSSHSDPLPASSARASARAAAETPKRSRPASGTPRVVDTTRHARESTQRNEEET